MNDPEKLNILLVDDRPENLLPLENLLESPDLNILKATSGNECLSLTLENDFALVLLDVQMPGMDGFETAKLMRGSERTKHIPIIFVTAMNKEQKQVFKGYDTGAVDYLFKPLDSHVLKSKVNVFLELHRQKRSLEKATEDLNQSVMELKEANKKILEQQKSVIEEERLKVLLQIAGATAHELNQPLMALLGHIELMGLNKDKPEKLTQHIVRIEEAGRRIADIVKKIQTIQHDETDLHQTESSITDLDQEIKILSMEDSDSDFETISAIFEDQKKISLYRASSIGEAVEVLRRDKYDVILLDYSFSGGSGLSFMRTLDEEELEVPIIVISGYGDEMIASKVIQAGAYDCLPRKMVGKKSLFRSIGNVMEKSRLKKELRTARKRIAEMATMDELTGLYNRRYFMEALERDVAKAKRYETELVLCMMDLDHFKEINDAYGHLAGDMVLSEIGRMLKGSIRESDLVCRYGGEEFSVILSNTQLKEARIVCERFREKVSAHTFEYDSSQFKITVSIGMATLNKSKSKSHNELVGYADKALYRAKKAGRNRVIEYTHE